PGTAPLGRVTRRAAEVGAHAFLLVEGPQPGEAGERGARPLLARQTVLPALRRLPADHRQQLRSLVTAQPLLHLARQTLRIAGAPARKETGVNQQESLLAMDERAVPQPK